MLSVCLQRFALGILGLLLTTTLFASDAPVFRWQKAITFEPTSDSVLQTVPFDSEIYAGTREGFPDLRLLDGDGQTVPFLIRQQIKQREVTARSHWSASNPELKPSDDGLEVFIRLKEDEPQPVGVAVITPLKNFDQRVDIFGTEPSQSERSLVKDARIFDYSQFMDVRRLEIRLPDNKCRGFRLILKTLTANQESEMLQLTRSLTEKGQTETNREERTTIQRRAFRIERVDFWKETKRLEEKSKVERDYALTQLESTEDTDKQVTTLTLTTHREPLTGFEIATSDTNFRRSIQVLVPHQQGTRIEWREIASGTISQFAVADFNESKLQIRFPEQRHETYRLRLAHGDSRPLKVDSVHGIGNVYEAVCLKSDHGLATVTFSSDLAKAPQFDLAAIQLALDRSATASSATLGPQSEATPASQMPVNVQGLINNPILIGAVVCVLVAILAICLLKAGKQISQLPNE